MNLTRLVIIGLILGTIGVYFNSSQTKENPLLKMPVVQNALNINSERIEKLSQNTPKELQTLAERGKTVGKHTSNILGSSVEINQEDQPVHEKAIGYGRYLYCQEVIKEYQATHDQP